ncbi:RNase P subunit p30 domain containing protein [Elaphomyces granulatus]|jgi:ribonuclease P/MRP protein subunit RPP1
MFYDLNVPYMPNDLELSHTLHFLAEVGYTAVALSQTVTGKLPAALTPPTPPSDAPQSLTLLTRLNIIFSDPSQNYRLANLAQSYSLIALRPTNEKCLLTACNNLDCDLISLDFSVRLPCHFKMRTLAAAIARGLRFEICYGPGVGSSMDARRNLIGNAMALIRATRGRGIIISSEAKRALAIRAPADVINLACVWGLSSERGKEAVCEEARKLVALARLKRTSWRGIVDIVDGGQKTPAGQTADQRSTIKTKPPTATVANPDVLKRKAAWDNGSASGETEQSLSNREMKRRAKKARLEVRSGNQSVDKAPARTGLE